MALKIVIISPGKVKEAWLKDALGEYQKRISRYCTLQLVAVADKADSLPVEQILKKEADHLLKRIRPQDWVIALDIKGQARTSEQLADQLMDWFVKGGSRIVFVIGGAHGLDESVLSRAHVRLSLSKMTWTHQMTRLLLVEQLYRAFRMIHGEPYHK